MKPRTENRSAWEVATDGLFDESIPNPLGGSSYTPTPMDMALDHVDFQFFNEDIQKFKERPEEAPELPTSQTGTIRTAIEEFKRSSDLGKISKGIDIDNVIPNPEDKSYDPNWKPNNPQNFYGIAPKYQPFIMAADNEYEQRRRQDIALGWQEQDRLIDNGTWLGYLLGGFAGITLGSPSNLIPIAKGLQYSKASYNFSKNVVRALPGLSIGAVMHEGIEEQAKTSHSLSDYVTNVFADMVFGSAMVGGIGAVSHSLWENKLWQSRKLISLFGRGAELNPVVNKEGVITGVKVYDATKSLSAAEVDFAQKMADSTMAKNGIFSVPYLGEATTKMIKLISPGFKGLNSRFESIRATADRIWSHGLVTEGIEKGEAAPAKFDDFMSQIRRLNSMDFDWFRGLHAEMNGVQMSRIPPAAAIQKSKLAYKEMTTPDNYVTQAEFSRRIRNVLINEESDSATQVNEAAARYRKVTDDLLNDYHEIYGLPKNFINPKTARGYLMRVYNLDWMRANENDYIGIVSGWLKESDELINKRLTPINDLKALIKTEEKRHLEYVSQKGLTDEQIKLSSDRITDAQKQLKAEKTKLENELRTNEDFHILTDDINALSADEAAHVKKITKEARKKEKIANAADKEHKAAKQEHDDLKFKLFTAEKNLAKAKTVATKEKNAALVEEFKAKVDELESKVSQLESESLKAQQEHEIEKQKIYDDLYNGKIPSHLYYRDSEGKYFLKDPKNRLKFRDTFESDFHREADARASYLSIVNETAEDIVSKVMDGLSGRQSADMLKRRSLMVPDSLLHDNQILSSNIAANLAQYRLALGKKIAFKAAFPDVTHNGGFDDMAVHFNKEYRGLSDSLNIKEKELDAKILKEENPDKKAQLVSQKTELRKERKKLQDDYNDNTEWLTNVYNRMMGRNWFSENPHRMDRKLVRGLMAFTSAARLGWVPFTQLSDLAALTFKHGLGSFVVDGLLPVFENMNGFRGTERGKAFMENAGHIAVGFQHTLDNYHDRNMMGQAQEYLPGMQWYSSDNLLRGVEWVSHSVGNFAGTNYIDNFLQRVSANIMQSKVIRLMQKHLDGTISKKETQSLLLFGLDPKEWAERFVNGWKEAGSHDNGFGGYLSYYYRWNDAEASSKMADTLARGVKDSVYTRRGMLDAPFWADGSIGVFMLQFKGYMFSSITRYLLPTLQQPDMEKMLGTMFMIAAGGAQYNLRRMAHNQEPETDPEQLLFHSLEEAGGLTVGPMWAIEGANTLSGGRLLKDFQNPRFANISRLGMTSGPASGMAQGLVRMMDMVASGEMNQVGLKQASHMVPYLSAWELQLWNDKLIEGLNIPQTQQQARARNRSGL